MLAIIMAIENDQDKDFVEELYEKYEDMMYHTAYSILNNHQDTEDIIQETVGAIIRSLNNFKNVADEPNMRSLIYTTCKNKAINMYNSKSRDWAYLVSTTVETEEGRETMDLPDFEADVAKLVITEENCRRLRQLIDKLDDDYKEIILFRFNNFSYEQIADMLCISSEAARQRYSRAKKKLMMIGGEELHAIYRN